MHKTIRFRARMYAESTIIIANKKDSVPLLRVFYVPLFYGGVSGNDYFGRFYSGDPAGQGHLPYPYCGGNPVIYVDKDGRVFWLIPVAAAVISGAINLASNWDKVDNFWQGLGYFGAGAASSALAFTGPAGWAGGGALLGAANTALGGGNMSDIIQNATIGGFAGLAGGAAGHWAAQNIGGIVINGLNIGSPVIKGIIGGLIGGAISGYVGGFTAGYIRTRNINAANQSGVEGLKFGALVGAATGAISSYMYSVENKLNPWTGRPDKSMVIGEGMDRLQVAERDLGSRTIKPDWPQEVNPYENVLGVRRPTAQGLEFNASYIDIQMEQNVYFYVMGQVGNNSSYYNLETARIFFQNYPKVYNVYHYQIRTNIRIYIYWR